MPDVFSERRIDASVKAALRVLDEFDVNTTEAATIAASVLCEVLGRVAFVVERQGNPTNFEELRGSVGRLGRTLTSLAELGTSREWDECIRLNVATAQAVAKERGL